MSDKIERLSKVLEVAKSNKLNMFPRWGDLVFVPTKEIHPLTDKYLNKLGCNWYSSLGIYIFDLGDAYV